jgi:hypothetical protein
VNFLCGVFNIHSWPFSVYPTFPKEQYLKSPRSNDLNFSFIDGDGKNLPWNKEKIITNFGSLRWYQLIESINAKPNNERSLVLLAKYIASKSPDINLTKEIKVYINGVFLFDLRKETASPIGIIEH